MDLTPEEIAIAEAELEAEGFYDQPEEDSFTTNAPAPVAETPTEYSGGVWEALKNIPEAAIGLTEQSLGGGLEWAGDRLDMEGLSGFGSEMSDRGRQTVQEGGQNLDPNSWAKTTYDIGSGIASFIPSLAVGGPVGISALEALKMFGSEYGNLKEQGATEEAAEDAGAINAGLNFGLNLGPLKTIYNPARSAFTRMVVAPLAEGGLNTLGTEAQLNLQENATGVEIDPAARAKALKQSFVTSAVSGATAALVANQITGSHPSKADLDIDAEIDVKSKIADTLLDKEPEVFDGSIETPTGTDVLSPPEPPIVKKAPVVESPISQELGADVEAQASAWINRGKATNESQVKRRASKAKPVVALPKPKDPPRVIELEREIAPAQLVESATDGSILSIPKDAPSYVVTPKVKKGAKKVEEPQQISLFEKIEKREKIQKQRGSWSNKPVKDTSEGLHTDEGLKMLDESMEIALKEKRHPGVSLKPEDGKIVDLDAGRPKDEYRTPALGRVRRFLRIPFYEMKDDPLTRPVFEAANQIGVRQVNIGLSRAKETLDPYLKLSPADKRAVNTSLITAFYKGNSFAPTPENFAKLGNTPEQIEGLMAVRGYLDGQAKENIEKALLKRNYDPNQLQEFMQGLDRNYIPAGRFGDYFVRIKDSSGGLIGVRFFEKAKDRDAVALASKMNGAIAEVGEVRKVSSDSYQGMPLNLVAKLNDAGFRDLDPDGIIKTKEGVPLTGFSKHLVSSKKIAGFSNDLERSLSEYAYGSEKFLANAQMKPIIDEAIIANKDRPQVVERLKQWQKSLHTSTADLGKIRAFYTAMYMGLNPRSAYVNATQTIQNTWPKLVQEMGAGKGSTALAKAHWDLYKHVKGQLKGEKKQIMDLLTRDGTIDSQAIKEFMSKSAGKNTLQGDKNFASLDKLMLFHGMAEKYNRSVAALAGLRAAEAKGITGAENKVAYVRDFVDTTQHVYAKWNRPEAGRGMLSLPYQFRHYALNQLQFMQRLGGKGTAAYVAAQMALSGIVGVPFSKVALSALESVGVDGVKAIEDFVTGTMDSAFGHGNKEDPKRFNRKVGKAFVKGLHKESNIPGAVIGAGLGSLAGPMGMIAGGAAGYGLAGKTDISGSAGMGDIIRVEKGGLRGQLGALIGGPLASSWDDIVKSGEAIQDGDLKSLAIDSPITPSSASSALQAYFAANNKRGEFRSKNKDVLLADPSLHDVAAKALGLTSKDLSDSYQDRSSGYIEKTNKATSNEGINKKIAEAEDNKDWKEVRRLRGYAAKKGLKVDEAAVKRFVNKWEAQRDASKRSR